MNGISVAQRREHCRALLCSSILETVQEAGYSVWYGLKDRMRCYTATGCLSDKIHGSCKPSASLLAIDSGAPSEYRLKLLADNLSLGVSPAYIA